MQSRIFTCSRILTNFAGVFTRLWRPREHVYFFYKIIIFHLNKEKDDIWSAYVNFNFFHKTINSHNLETANHIANIIFVLYSTDTCWPIKTHVLSKLFSKVSCWSDCVRMLAWKVKHLTGYTHILQEPESFHWRISV